MKMNIAALTYFSIIALTMLQSMVSFASQAPTKVERAIVQMDKPGEAYAAEYFTYKKCNYSFLFTTQNYILEDFYAYEMPVYLVDGLIDHKLSKNKKTIKTAKIKLDNSIPCILFHEANELLKEIPPRQLPKAIYFKGNYKKKVRWYLLLFSAEKPLKQIKITQPCTHQQPSKKPHQDCPLL